MVPHFTFITNSVRKEDWGGWWTEGVLILSKAPIKVKNIDEGKQGGVMVLRKKRRGNGGTDEKPNMPHSQKRRLLLMSETFEEERERVCVLVCACVEEGDHCIEAHYVMAVKTVYSWQDRTPADTHIHTHNHKSALSPPLLAMEHAECGKQRLRHVPDKILPLWASVEMQTGLFWHAAATAATPSPLHPPHTHTSSLTSLTAPDPLQPCHRDVCHPLPLLSLFKKSLILQTSPFSHTFQKWMKWWLSGHTSFLQMQLAQRLQNLRAFLRFHKINKGCCEIIYLIFSRIENNDSIYIFVFSYLLIVTVI